MKTLKILSIIGLVIGGIGFICFFMFIDADIEVAAGWGFYSSVYLIALSIVGVIKSRALKE